MRCLPARRAPWLAVILAAAFTLAAVLAYGPASLEAAHSRDTSARASGQVDHSLASGPSLPDAAATPNCPGGLSDVPQAECTSVKVHGNTYRDSNTNGEYDPHRGDSRLAGVEVRLVDAATGFVIAQATTNADGYYSFPGLLLGPVYRVEVAIPPGWRATTPDWREIEARDFSTFWCCSARADFGLAPAHVPTLPPVPPPIPGQGTPAPPPCCEIPTGRQIHLPILNYEANANVCASIIEVQNVGGWPSKALLVLWGAPGFCPPQCAGPLKVECSGLLAPGSAWNFIGAQLPSAAKSGMVFSAPAISEPDGGDVFADRLCEALYNYVVGDCDEFRRFKKAFNELGVWETAGGPFDFRRYPGASMAAEVVRKCPGDLDPGVDVTGGYAGLADELLGAYDPVYGGYTFFAPLVYSDRGGYTSWIYIQNGGIECSSVELWFKAQDDCLRPVVCDVLTLAPGETFQFDAASCVGPGWLGSAWVRGSQPLSLVVDAVGRDTLMSYHGVPGDLRYTYDGVAYFSAGSEVAFGPLVYSEYQGWDSVVQVQNLSSVSNARVKVYFLDRAGGVLTTLTDWICPNGSQSFYLPVIAALPGNWTGAVRVESQSWFAPGSPAQAPPNVSGVVQMVKYVDVTRSRPLEAMAYTLTPEFAAFDWQLGAGSGGLESGVGRIGIPSFFKDRDGTGLTTELAIANVVPKPGYTDFVVYVYDQNGLVSDFCQKLAASGSEYIDVDAHLGMLPAGFKGSAVISAVYWDHRVFGADGGHVRNLVGLVAAKVERSGTVQGVDVPGDESAAISGSPILGGFAFAGPPPGCPGLPPGGVGGPGGGSAPTATPGLYPTAPAAPTSPATALPPPVPPPPPFAAAPAAGRSPPLFDRPLGAP